MTLGVFFSISEKDNSGNPLAGAQKRLDAIMAGLGNSVKASDITKKHARTNPWDPPDYAGGAKYLVGLAPDALFSSCWPTMTALQVAIAAAGADISVVYAGLFNDGARKTSPYPTGYDQFGDNVTGFVSHEFDVCAGWPRYLRAIAPARVTQAAVLYESGPAGAGGQEQFNAIIKADSTFVLPPQSPLHIDLKKMTKSSDLESAIKALGNSNGLIVTTGALTASLGDLIVKYANKYSVFAIYPNKMYLELGGLISWGTDLLGLYQRAGEYLAQIIQNPGDPVPSFRINHSFEVAFNSATAGSASFGMSASNIQNIEDNVADWVWDGTGWHQGG